VYLLKVTLMGYWNRQMVKHWENLMVYLLMDYLKGFR